MRANALNSTNSDENSSPVNVLATDLDGTFIPLDDVPQNVHDLKQLGDFIRENQLGLVFVTGRHLESVQQAISQFQLPRPDWIICDVGTTVCQIVEDDIRPSKEYEQHLSEMIADFPISRMKDALATITTLRIQEEEKQGPFKLSYYVNQHQLDETVEEIQKTLSERDAPYSIIGSIDPFNGDGLIDLLPANVSKAYALEWWCEFQLKSREQVIFAGDSGNDLAAFLAGHRTVIVGNADRKIAERVRVHFAEQGWQDRLFLAESQATSGVLEGVLSFCIE